MELNDSAKTFLDQMKKMHTVSRLPYCLLDGGFSLLWCNEAALEAYPPLAMPRGVPMLLEGYDLADIRDEITAEGRFCLSADPGNLFSGRGLLLYAAPAECGEIYVLQPLEIVDAGTGTQPQGLMRSIAAFESHYRSPLTSIFSSVSLLRAQIEREKKDDPKLDEYLHKIGHSSMELMRASQMMTDYTRLTNGLYPHRRLRVDLFAYLENLLGRISQEMTLGDVPLSYEIPDRALFTVTETEPLYSALCQLISNAVRFTRPGNSITVKASVSGETVSIIVSDRGLGIPASVASHIFEPYFSYSPEGAPFAGNGLGLSIARECAAILGGDITFTTSEGQGSSFRLTLPLRDDDSLPLSARSPEEDLDLASSIRVLLSDCLPCETP